MTKARQPIKLGNGLGRAQRGKTRSEKIAKNNREQERHQHHTRITTHGRHRRRRISHGLRLVNRTARHLTSTSHNRPRESELYYEFWGVLKQLECDGVHQQPRYIKRDPPNILCEGRERQLV